MAAARVFTSIALGCAAIASIVTLLWSGAFPESVPPAPFNAALAEARGWSAVTLALAIPLAVLALAMKRSVRARLALAGVHAYLVYTYLEMAVSPPFTPLYLVYIAAFATALPAGIIVLRTIPRDTLPAEFAEAPQRSIGVYSILFAALLAFAWLGDIATRTVAGAFGWPSGEAAIRHVVHALDLGLLVPLGAFAGVLLVRRSPTGFVLAGINLVMAVCMGGALVAMVGVSSVVSGKSVLAAAPFFVAWIVWVVLAWLFFFKRAPRTREHDRPDRRYTPPHVPSRAAGVG